MTYFGKGQILLLINGREAKSSEEVNALQPSQITEIVVDNMPGAKYDSRYSSILNIKTTLEKPALMIYNTDAWGRHYSGAAGFTSQRKIKNTLIDYAYSFRKRKNTLYSKQIEENFQTGNAFERVFMDITFSNRCSHDWHIGTQSKLKTGTLNMKYSGYCSSNKPEYLSSMQYTSISRENFDIQRTGKYEEQQHVATLEYEHRFSNFVKLSVGARYSHVYNKNNSKENDISTFYNLRENRYALYAEGNFQWQKIVILLGLRSERFDKRYHCTAQDVTNYKDLFFLPSFSLSYQLSENLQISLSGNNKVFLPSFSELTPITTYLNQYSYMIGNPLLKPTVRYDFGIGMVWLNKLNVKLEYNLIKNDRIAFSVPDERNAQVLKYTYTNIDRSRQFTGMLTFSDHLFNRHAINLSAGILIPNSRIPYMDQHLHRTTPSYFAQLYCNWQLGRMINFSFNYTFQSKSYDKADIYRATHNLGCNMSIVPIKNKLSFNIQVNDILKKATGNWETNYGYIRTQQFNNADSRNITLSLRYIFNSFKSIKQGSSNSEEIERL